MTKSNLVHLRKLVAIRKHHQERGMVTAETATVLPVLVFVAALLAGTLWVGTAQADMNDSARFVARSMSQGDSQSEAMKRLGPRAKDVNITVKDAGDVITVRVSKRLAVPTLSRFSVALAGSSTAVKE